MAFVRLASIKLAQETRAARGEMGEFGASCHVCRRGMRDEPDAWVEGKARSQRWGVLGLLQIGFIQTSTGDKSSEGGDG